MLINQYQNNQNTLCVPAQSVIDSVRRILESKSVQGSGSSGMSQKVKDALIPELVIEGWRENFPIDQSVAHNDYASFYIDMFLDLPSNGCSHLHRFLLQFMFDNRQAIGTNLLKFDVAAYNAHNHNRNTTTIGLCVEKDHIKKLGWDGSLGSAQEYLHAITGPYGSILKNPPIIFAIKNLEVD